jgi:hypothetical protein
MSKSHTGKKLTEEHKKNISIAAKGKPLKESTKAKLREKRAKQIPPTLGQTRTPEQRARMSEAAKLRWAKQKQEV